MTLARIIGSVVMASCLCACGDEGVAKDPMPDNLAAQFNGPQSVPRNDPDADLGEPLFVETHPLGFVRVFEFERRGDNDVRVLWRTTDGNGNAYYQELLYVCGQNIGAVIREGKGWGTEGRNSLLAAPSQPEKLYDWERDSVEFAVGSYACKNRYNPNWDQPG